MADWLARVRGGLLGEYVARGEEVMIFRYFSLAERSRRAHIRVWKALGTARTLASKQRRLNTMGQARLDRAFDDLVGHTERCLNFYLPQTWQGGTEEQQPRGDNL